ncbi:MAG: nucleoside hydrolase, partial [Piptocephalis tieghemiana]
VIIDTDPGVDDALALILALASPHLHVLALTISYGNVSLPHTLRNTLSLLHLIQQWRRDAGLSPLPKPILAIGAEKPLERELLNAAYIHASDGFGGIHASDLSLAPPYWESLLPPHLRGILPHPQSSSRTPSIPAPHELPYILSPRPAAEELIHQATSHPDDSLTLITLGPFTNLSTAWSLDPVAMARYSRVVSMAGCLNSPGNVTPFAEFNTWADAEAARRVFEATVPSSPDHPYLRHLILIPLNVTTKMQLSSSHLQSHIPPSSPLSPFLQALLKQNFAYSSSLASSTIVIHDATAVQYVIDLAHNSLASRGWKELGKGQGLDIRVESKGQWTSGMLLTDQR